MGEGGQEEGWVICRVFKKKNHTQKTPQGSPIISTTTWSINPCSEAGTLEQMLQSINNDNTQSRRNQFLDAENNSRRFLKLPSLQYDSPNPVHVSMLGDDEVSELETGIGIQDWAALDRLVASHLNGPTETPKTVPSFMSYCCPLVNGDQLHKSSSTSSRGYGVGGNVDYDQNEGGDLIWSFPGASSSNDQLCHLSNVPI